MKLPVGSPRRGRRSTLRAATVASLLALALAPRFAHADVNADATAMLREGNRLLGEGRYGEALKRYESAFALVPSANLLVNMGTALRQLGRRADAITAYERYLAHPNAELSRRPEIEAIVREMAAKVGRLVVRVREPDASVSLDGELVVNASEGFSKWVEPGTHTLMLTKSGTTSASATVALRAGEERSVELALTSTPSGQPATEVGPSGPLAAWAGGGTLPSGARREARGSAGRTAGYVLVGVGAASLVAAAVTGVLVLQKGEVVDEECPSGLGGRCRSQRGLDAAAAGRTLALVNTITLGVGAAGVGVGAYLVLSAPSASAPAHGAAAGRALNAGLTFRGAF